MMDFAKKYVSFPRKRESRVAARLDSFRARMRACWVRAFAGMTILVATGAGAQTVAGDTFADGPNGAKVHVASRFVCPAKIGPFERDAVGETDPETGAD